MKYIYQYADWPEFNWNHKEQEQLLAAIRYKQGKYIGQMESLGFKLRSEAVLKTLTLDILKSNEIEGELLSPDKVRSSIARRLGMDIAGLVPSDRNIDGVVEMILDATQKFEDKLTKERLFGWHSALFPTGFSGMYKITVGQWRIDDKGPMQVVSGAIGREKVHFEAPKSNVLEKEMTLFLKWFNEETKIDPVLKAAIAHLWFITIHPFDDGNGRIARAISDMQLARADESSQRFYSMSAQIQKERKVYYDILESTQKDDLDISNWLNWFLHCLDRALDATSNELVSVIEKAKFWDVHRETILNKRQNLMLNKILDGFEGKLTSSKWAKIAKCSPDTGLRDIQELIDKGILVKMGAGGRSTSYGLKMY